MKPDGDAPTREAWVDVAKGLAIVAVAVYHAALIGMNAGLVDGSWRDVNAVFAKLRMPLFFFASGLFAASTVRRPWPRLWSGTIAKLVWCFVIWAVIRFAYFQVVPLDSRPQEHDVSNFLLSPVLPVTGLWYLHALVIFYVVTKLMQGRIPPWLQIGAATVLGALAMSVLDIDNLSYAGAARHYVFFLVAAHFRTTILPWVGRTPAWLPVPVALVFTVLAVEVREVVDVPGAVLAVCALGVVTGCTAAAVLSRTRLAAPFAYLGRRTLYVYVSHILLICFAIRVLEFFPDRADSIDRFTPLLVAAWAVVASIVLWQALRRTPLNALYEPPAWFRGERRTSVPSR